MIKKRNIHVFRIIGITICLCGLLLPWFIFNIDPGPSSTLLVGWEEILISFTVGIEYVNKGFTFALFISLAEGISLIVLAIYTAYAILALKGEFKGNRAFSLLLIGVAMINILYAQNATTERLLLGFWVFLAGLLLCITFEWVYGQYKT